MPWNNSRSKTRRRFCCGRIPGWDPSPRWPSCEHSSGGRQKLGRISKQGNPMMRSLLVEAGHSAVRLDAELGKDYKRLKLRRGPGVAKVAIARKLAVRMYWMLRQQVSYAQLVRMQGSPRGTLVTK